MLRIEDTLVPNSSAQAHLEDLSVEGGSAEGLEDVAMSDPLISSTTTIQRPDAGTPSSPQPAPTLAPAYDASTDGEVRSHLEPTVSLSTSPVHLHNHTPDVELELHAGPSTIGHLPTYGPNQTAEFNVSHLFENPGYPRVERGKGKGKAKAAEGGSSSAKRKFGEDDDEGSGGSKKPRIDCGVSKSCLPDLQKFESAGDSPSNTAPSTSTVPDVGLQPAIPEQGCVCELLVINHN